MSNDKKWAFGHDTENSHPVHNVDLHKLANEHIVKTTDDHTFSRGENNERL